MLVYILKKIGSTGFGVGVNFIFRKERKFFYSNLNLLFCKLRLELVLKKIKNNIAHNTLSILQKNKQRIKL